jgi:hypothetical protein
MIELLKEPPFRIFAAALVKRLSRSLRGQELWDTWDRPEYLTGVLHGADQAKNEGVTSISVIEFGVASGQGLLALQAAANAVEIETGVEVYVYGFDSGLGLGAPAGGYRDHPDKWQAGDYPMLDEKVLRSRFTPKTSLVLGDVAETAANFVATIQKCPIGFIAFDLDYYSSTMKAFDVFRGPKRNLLAHVPLYFDDTCFFGASAYAGELLAITEFNTQSSSVKIDPWYALRFNRPFSERRWLSKMYVANDMERSERLAESARDTLIHP